ncbi:MAG: hypothetical protein U5K30_14025 [Acidimicrobiales bacterium]|nr:hypothetical protein [Acidimicrobiales bacterium]
MQKDVDLALDRIGIDAGTPILTFDPPDGPSIFGPVLSRRVSGDSGPRVVGRHQVVARETGLSEIKRRRPRFSTFDTFPIRRRSSGAGRGTSEPSEEACAVPSTTSAPSED